MKLGSISGPLIPQSTTLSTARWLPGFYYRILFCWICLWRITSAHSFHSLTNLLNPSANLWIDLKPPFVSFVFSSSNACLRHNIFSVLWCNYCNQKLLTRKFYDFSNKLILRNFAWKLHSLIFFYRFIIEYN